MAIIEFDFSELLALEAVVPEIGHMTDDLRFAWDQVVPGLVKEVDATFSDEGPGWAPLALSTQLERGRKGYGAAHPILVRDGSMRQTFVQHPLVVSEPQFLFYGSTSEIAKYHQRGNRSMPARPIIQARRLTPVVQRTFEKAFVERANQLWHQATGRGTLRGKSLRSAA